MPGIGETERGSRRCVIVLMTVCLAVILLRFVSVSIVRAESAVLAFVLCNPMRFGNGYLEEAPITSAIYRGDLLIGSPASTTGSLVFRPALNCFQPVTAQAVAGQPSQTQTLSPNGKLLFKAATSDILATPTSGQGGPGTAARSENRHRFTGPLAVGGGKLGVYGVAAQSDGLEPRILLFEAYERSHHQGTIWNAPTGVEIRWLGWGGAESEFLYVLLREQARDNLYSIDPMFPDFTNGRRDCYYSTKLATDCMMKLTRAVKRKAQLVLADVKAITIAGGPQSPVSY